MFPFITTPYSADTSIKRTRTLKYIVFGDAVARGPYEIRRTTFESLRIELTIAVLDYVLEIRFVVD